jgi:hypothetical protein
VKHVVSRGRVVTVEGGPEAAEVGLVPLVELGHGGALGARFFGVVRDLGAGGELPAREEQLATFGDVGVCHADLSEQRADHRIGADGVEELGCSGDSLLEDAARTAGDLALCEEQAGRFGDAMKHARRALAEATPDMMKKEPWKSYQAAVERLSSQVGLVMLP